MKNMSLFSQILLLIPKSLFKKLVKKHNAEYRSKGFSSWEQLVSMLFCQFAQAASLREITHGLQSCEGKLSHLGIDAPSRSTLANANKVRSWKLYKELFDELLKTVSSEFKSETRNFNFSQKLYSIDSSTIDLCLNVFSWAKYRTTKGAIKLHVRLDHDGYLPDFLLVTDGKTSDVSAAWEYPYDAGTISVFDRGYSDFKLFQHITDQLAFFVTRLKSNAKYKVVEELAMPTKHDPDLISDSIIKLTGQGADEAYSGNLRLICSTDTEGRDIRFLTNNFELDVETISNIYRERSKIELFFKEIKQNLKVKTFVGTSENAVMIQIYTALITILLLKYLKMKSTFKWSMSNLAALIRMNLFTHKSLGYVPFSCGKF